MPPLSGEQKFRRLEKALARDGWCSMGEAVAKARTGEYQILDGEAAAAITHMPIKPDGTKVMVVIAMGGTRAGCEALMVTIEDFARAQRCASVEFTGRPGWLTYRKDPRGYRVVAVVARKDLSYEQHPEGNLYH